ncbi:hypothetical protein M422DRAFT_218829 [Sphaerobolus stellatus SS14]|nr:hypothetical protein M422DRAFT_218829 [Sphaerobolus stellatus SS14]
MSSHRRSQRKGFVTVAELPGEDGTVNYPEEPQDRPGQEIIDAIGADDSKLQGDFVPMQVCPLTSIEMTRRIVRCNVLQKKGQLLASKLKINQAIPILMEAIRAILGSDFVLPLPLENPVKVLKYMELSTWERADVAVCCNLLGACYQIKGNVPEALRWHNEVIIIHLNARYASLMGKYDWDDYIPMNIDYWAEIISAYVRKSDIYNDLENTSAALEYGVYADMYISQVLMNNKEMREILEKDLKLLPLSQLASARHPDPELSLKLKVTRPDLQMDGSWKRIRLEKGGNISPRRGFARFMYNGCFYVFAGDPTIGCPMYKDFYYLDLQKMDKWRRLPDYPTQRIRFDSRDNRTGWSNIVICVWEDKAYLFTGRLIVDYFDLKRKEWGVITTRYLSPGSWPFTYFTAGHNMHIVDGKMYTFGGFSIDCLLGTNLLLELDLQTKTWRRVSGTVQPKPDPSCPGFRRAASSWVDHEKRKIFFMGGEADIKLTRSDEKSLGSHYSYVYSDLWSWHLDEKKWTRERIHGNPPGARTEMGWDYNPKLKRLIAFGGFSSNAPLQRSTRLKNIDNVYSYFADTYIFDPAAFSWKHVLTRGFPTYRALGEMFCDPETGKIFLFGGYTDNEIVPSRIGVTSAFNDIWQLRLDMEGGFWDEVDLEEDLKTAKAGPWQRCFNCGASGDTKKMRKCQGTCQGKASFCDTQCQKEGWSEHKMRHECRRA